MAGGVSQCSAKKNPPLLLASDAAILPTVYDGTVFVVGAGTTPSGAAQMARQELKDSNLGGVVLSGAAESACAVSGDYNGSGRPQKTLFCLYGCL